MIGTECLAAPVAVKLVAAGTKHLAAGSVRARADFQESVAAVFVVLDLEALEEGVAGGAGGGSKSAVHKFIRANQRCIVKRKVAKT